MNMRADPNRDNGFAEALRREAGLPLIVTRPAGARTGTTAHPPLPLGALEIGQADTGGAVGLDLAALIAGRLLIQGASGAGKSWTLRRLLEQSAGAIQQIVIDPEGEFGSLAEANGFLRLDGSTLDIAALSTAASRVRTHRLSVLLDLSDCERETQMIAGTAFLRGLIDAPRDEWHAALVAIDEAHLLAPFGSDVPTSVRKAAVGAMSDLMGRGRKRGLCGVLATQRLSRLSKSVASEAANFLVGLNTLDLDIRRAAETIGWDARRAFDRLPLLAPGHFVAVGPAFTRSPCVLHVGAVASAHHGAAPAVSAPEARSPADAAQLLDLDTLTAESGHDAERRAEAARPDSLRAVRRFIRDPGFVLAGRVMSVLERLAPSGARLTQMAAEFGVSLPAVADACALLDRYGVLEFNGAGDGRAARLTREFRE